MSKFESMFNRDSIKIVKAVEADNKKNKLNVDEQEKLRYYHKLAMEMEKYEHIPDSEEVMLLFARLVREKNYETCRKFEDEQGLYLWEIVIPQENGSSIEYGYCRKGDYKKRGLPGGSASETAIHVTFFDEDGIPESGHSVLKLINDKWVETL